MSPAFQSRPPPRLPGEGPVPAPRAVEGLSAGSADTRHAVLNRLPKLPRGTQASAPPSQHLPGPPRASTVTTPAAAQPSVGCTEMDGQTHATGWWHRLETSWPSTHRLGLHKERLDSAAGNALRTEDSPASWLHGDTAYLYSWRRQAHRGGPTCGHNTHFAGSLRALGELVVITRLQTWRCAAQDGSSDPPAFKETPPETT